ncbi:MAG: hypothetical protein WAN05_00365 [Roseiarcus sp.]
MVDDAAKIDGKNSAGLVGEIAEMFSTAVHADLCAPSSPSRHPINAARSAAVIPTSFTIAVVFRVRRLSQIVRSIVSMPAVPMIDLFKRPAAAAHRPNDAMRLV